MEIEECLQEYSPSQINTEYNDEPVLWCNRCLSLSILSLNSTVKGCPNTYCEHCLSTNISEGSIFEWLALQPPRVFKNLKEYKEYQEFLNKKNDRDSITNEIEEMISEYYVVQYTREELNYLHINIE